MPHDWRTATLLQARSDYDMFLRLQRSKDAPICQVLHYLQMTTEKLAKAFLTPPGGQYPKTHDAFVKFVRAVQYYPNFPAAFGFTRDGLFRAYVQSLLPLAQDVEDLSPDGGDHANPEYPWEAGGVIYVPVEYSFAGLSLQSPSMLKLLKFIETCFALA